MKVFKLYRGSWILRKNQITRVSLKMNNFNSYKSIPRTLCWFLQNVVRGGRENLLDASYRVFFYGERCRTHLINLYQGHSILQRQYQNKNFLTISWYKINHAYEYVFFFFPWYLCRSILKGDRRRASRPAIVEIKPRTCGRYDFFQLYHGKLVTLVHI